MAKLQEFRFGPQISMGGVRDKVQRGENVYVETLSGFKQASLSGRRLIIHYPFGKPVDVAGLIGCRRVEGKTTDIVVM